MHIHYLLKKHQLKIVFAILFFMLFISLLNAKNDGATYDEIAHIPAGYSYLAYHEMRLNPEHPPLLKNLSGLPLQMMNVNFDTQHSSWTTDNVADNQWNAGRHFLYNSNNDADTIIFWSRVPLILISLLLGFFIFKWTRELFSLSAGLLALIFFAFNPNVLGHNHLVTTDLGIATFTVISFYYFLKFIKYPSWKNVFLAGFTLGLMQLTKFSSVITFPIFCSLVVIFPFIKKIKPDQKRIFEFFHYIFKGFSVFLISIILVWVVYYFNTFNMSAETTQSAIDYYFKIEDPNIKTIYTRKILNTLNNHDILRPLGEYMFGIARVFQRVAGGNVTYFFGEVSSDAKASYFPLVFLMKEPLPILMIIFFILLIAIKQNLSFLSVFYKKSWSEKISSFSELIRKKIDEVAILFFIFLYLTISITGNLNIGFRHLFPIIPFIYILISGKITTYRQKIPHGKNFINLMIIIMTIWLIAEALFTYPYYISYFNQTAGGPRNGYHFVTDSNADWGQDIKRLQQYLLTHPEIDKIRINYFGGGDVNYYLGQNKVISWWDTKRPIENGWYAISALFIQESLYDQKKKSTENYSWLKNYQPITQIGTSIFIYHITDIN